MADGLGADGVFRVRIMRRSIAYAAAMSLSALVGAAPAAAKQDANARHLSCTGAPNEVRVVIKDVQKSVGLITAELYRNDEATFLSKEGRAARLRVAARSPVTEVCLHAPDAAGYAVAVYHDKNANQKFDKGPLGLPAEPFGVSNNPQMRLAPPKIADALFPVEAGGVTVEILLHN